MLKAMISSIVAKHFKRKLVSWTIKEEDVEAILKEIRITLLDADVSLLVVKKLIKGIKEKTVGQTMSEGQDAQAFVLNAIKEELVTILGQNDSEINVSKPLVKILMVGLQGSGKTTTCSKLAYYFQKKFSKKPLLVALDIYRPAAIEQLRTLSKQINVDFFEKGEQNPVKTADESIGYATKNKDNLIIYDTAGRLQTNVELMEELKNIRNKVNPDEIIFVADAMSGQEIINVANEFNKALGLTGIIISKLEGDARAGAALSLTSEINVPIYFSGVGERPEALEQFHPERIAERILGLGDILTLSEKANEIVDKEKMKKSFARMLAGKMDLEDLMVQMQQIGKMGDLSSLGKMMPGAGKLDENKLEEGQKKFRVWSILMSSMTLKERRNPSLFKKEPSRKQRVIKGSGRTSEEFNKLLKEWEVMRDKMADVGKKLMKGMNPFGGAI